VFLGGAWVGWPRIPQALRVDAPASAFSAGRALAAIDTWASAPRVSGSRAHRAVVDDLARRLGALGLRAEVRQENGLANVEAHAGDDRGAGVWLVAHSDSVRGSPGAADDGLGLGVLVEAARVLTLDGAPPGLHVLVTDGEEIDLLGARAFVEGAPPAHRVVINVEARGSEGPAFMFQTAGPTDALLSAWRASGCTAQAGSLARTVYELMPNDTDFTVFREAGAWGYDFALIHGAWRYHTPDDRVEGLDPRAVQQIGDCVVGLARAWLADVPDPGSAPLAWQQVGPVLVAAPGWAVRAAAIAALLVAVWGARGRRWTAGVAAWLASAGVAAGLGVGALAALVAAWPGFLARPAETEQATPLYVGAFALPILAVALVSSALRRWFPRWAGDLGAGWLLVQAGLAGGVALASPEVGLVLVPGGLAAATALAATAPAARGRARVALDALVPLLVGASGALIGPVLLALPVALTSRAFPLLTLAPLLLVGILLAPGPREKPA
jgi:hypothetical protein